MLFAHTYMQSGSKNSPPKVPQNEQKTRRASSKQPCSPEAGRDSVLSLNNKPKKQLLCQEVKG